MTNLRLKVRLTAIIFAMCFAVTALGGLEWDTAAEVATCRNHAGYEELATRTTDLLSKHKINSTLMYFAPPDKDGIEALTTDPHGAGRWGLYVHIRDAREARRLVAGAIKDGLAVTLSTKDPMPTPEVGARPKWWQPERLTSRWSRPRAAVLSSFT